MFCRISLKNITRPAYQYYQYSELNKLLAKGLSPILPFTRSQFHQSAPTNSKRMSISGMQPKLSLGLSTQNKSLELTNQGGLWILKPSPLEYPFAAENEHCAMLSGKLFGINMAECGLLEFADGELVYVTRRFDRQDGIPLAQEDLLQCMGYNSEHKYMGSYEEAGKALREICGGRLGVIKDYFIRILHSFIIGNDDLHLKNFSVTRSMLHPGPGYETLTPHYDVLFAQAFTNRSILGQMALELLIVEKEEGLMEHSKVYGFYTAQDFMDLGLSLGLPQKTIEKIIVFACHKLPELLDLIDRSFMPQDMKQRAQLTCTERIKQLRMGLTNNFA